MNTQALAAEWQERQPDLFECERLHARITERDCHKYQDGRLNYRVEHGEETDSVALYFGRCAGCPRFAPKKRGNLTRQEKLEAVTFGHDSPFTGEQVSRLRRKGAFRINLKRPRNSNPDNWAWREKTSKKGWKA